MRNRSIGSSVLRFSGSNNVVHVFIEGVRLFRRQYGLKEKDCSTKAMILVTDSGIRGF